VLDLLTALIEGAPPFIEAFTSNGGYIDLLCMRLGCHTSDDALAANREEAHTPTKEPYTPTKETSVSAKEPHAPAKEALVSTKELVERKALHVLHTALCDRMHGPRVRGAVCVVVHGAEWVAEWVLVWGSGKGLWGGFG